MKPLLTIEGKTVLALLASGLAVAGAGLAAHSTSREESLSATAAEAAAPAAQVGVYGPVKEAAGGPSDRFGDLLPKGAVARLGTVRFRHGAVTFKVAFAAEGKVLASSGSFGHAVCLWDVATGRPLHRLAFLPISFHLAVSPDGKTVLTDSLILIDAATGKELRRLNPMVDTSYRVAFSPDGKTVAGTKLNGSEVILWEAGTGKELLRLEGHAGVVRAVAFSPDGKTLASAGEDMTVRLWDVATGKELQRLPGHEKGVWSVAFRPGGKVLASAGADRVIRLWDAATGQPLRQCPGDAQLTSEVAFSPDGKLLASAGWSGKICLWNPDTGNEIRSWQAHVTEVRSVAFSPDGKILASAGGLDSAIRLWDAATGKELNPLAGHAGRIVSLSFAADGKSLFSCSRDGKVLEWDLATGGARGKPFGPTHEGQSVHHVEMSLDGRLLAFTCWQPLVNKPDPGIRLWDTVSGKELKALKGHVDYVESLKVSPDGKLVASTAKDGLRLWDVATGKELHHVQGKLRDGSPLAFSPDSRLLAWAGVDRTICLWDVATGKEVRRWDGKEEYVGDLIFSPDGAHVAGVTSSSVRVWAAGTGQELAAFNLANPTALAFSPSGRVLAIGSTGAGPVLNGATQRIFTIHLVEVASGQEIRQIDAPQGWIFALAFAPDGRVLASGGGDSTILLWDLTGWPGDGKLAPAPLTVGELESSWSDLSGEAPQADRALWALVRAAKQSLPFLKDHMRPLPPAPPELVAGLLADLDNKAFGVRQKASRALEKLGEAVEPALRKALESKPTLEVRQHLEQILKKRDKEVIRQLRAIEVVEQIGTMEARQLLETTAKGAVNPRVAQAAAAALARLAKRHS
jgi:WD40 repeat protein